MEMKNIIFVFLFIHVGIYSQKNEFIKLNNFILNEDSLTKKNCSILNSLIQEHFFSELGHYDSLLIFKSINILIEYKKNYGAIRERHGNSCLKTVNYLSALLESSVLRNAELDEKIDSIYSKISFQHKDSYGFYGTYNILLENLFNRYDSQRFIEIYQRSSQNTKLRLLEIYFNDYNGQIRKTNYLNKIRQFENDQDLQEKLDQIINLKSFNNKTLK